MSSDTSLVLNVLARDRTQQTMRGIAKKVAGAAAVAGAAGGAALATGMAGNLEAEAASDMVAASLGLTPEQQKQTGAAASKVFAGAYAGNMTEASDAVGSVVSSIQGLKDASDETIAATTTDALNYAKVFKTDVPTAMNTVGILLKTKLAKDSTEAFDLMTAASQKVPEAMRGDLMAAVDEYGKHFSDMGYSGAQSMSILVSAAEAGPIVLDKIGDSLKEFSLLGTDMSTSSVAAYDAIGLSAKDMAADLLAGGDRAGKATSRIAQGLLDIKDPVERANQSIALFGSPLEDMSVQQIPDFLAALAEAPPALAGVEGATKTMGDTLNDNGQARIDAFRNSLQVMAMNLASTEGPLGSAASGVMAFGETALSGGAQLGMLAVGMQATGAGAGIMAGASAVASGALRGVGFAVRFALGPIGIIITVTALMVAGLIYAYKHSSKFRAVVQASMQGARKAFQWLWNAAKSVFSWLRSNWPLVLAILTGPIGMAALFIKRKFSGIVGWVRGMKSRIGGAARGMWGGITSAFKTAINTIIGGWNRLSFGIPGFDVGPISYGGFSMSPPQIPYLAKGGIVSRPTLAMIGEGRQKEAVIPLDRLAGMIGGGRGMTLQVIGGASRFERMFVEMIREFVRVKGQGNVQTAFGRG